LHLSHSDDKKRPGPGRKSNAEHAIAFYEYVLNANDDDDEEEANEEEEEEEGQPLNKSTHKKSAVSLEDDVSTSASTMDSQEFRNQHNDLCDVCNKGGKLLCCSTCNLVFHVGCVRPILTELESDDGA
jgi:chromodomain-helicase-DNA-binding protein 4